MMLLLLMMMMRRRRRRMFGWDAVSESEENGAAQRWLKLFRTRPGLPGCGHRLSRGRGRLPP
eukprot:9096809-Pyramimonas_sp.AAC.1